MIAIPVIFNFIKISLDYFGKAKPQTLQVNRDSDISLEKEIH